MNEPEKRRERVVSPLWVALITLYLIGQAVVPRFYEQVTAPSVLWDSDGSLYVRSISDGPFVITHLTSSTGTSEGAKAVTALPHPIAIVDSEGAVIDAKTLAALPWIGIDGTPRPAPEPGAPVRALYYRPLVTGQAKR